MRLLQADEVSGTIAAEAPLEATMAVVAPGALTEEATGEAMAEVAVSLETPKAAEVKEEVMGEARGVIAKLKE